MKKQLKTIGFAALAAFFVTTGAFAAAGQSKIGEGNLCELITKFQEIFKMIRTLAFLGAGFLIAKWAWGYITAGKIDDPMKEVKEKGISMIVGFVLLFGIGVVLQIVTSAAGLESIGCHAQLTGGW